MWRPWANDAVNENIENFQEQLQVEVDVPRTSGHSPVGRGNVLQSQAAKIIINVVEYFSKEKESEGPNKKELANVLKRTSSATGVSVSTIKQTKRIGKDILNYRTPTKKKQVSKVCPFWKIDCFTTDMLRRIVYDIYRRKSVPTIREVLQELKQRTSGTGYEYPYGRTMTYRLLRSLGFKYKKTVRSSALLESDRIRKWRFQYLSEIREFRSLGYDDIYLDETWYDTNSAPKYAFSDGSKECELLVKSGKGQRIVILHAGGRKGFIPNAQFITHKSMLEAPADYHGTMNATIFEKWFIDQFIPSLEQPSVIVMDNASYHSRRKFVIPRRKQDILQFMCENNIGIPSPIPTIPVLVSKIKSALKERNQDNAYVIDELAAMNGHKVLRLPPYHCTLNPIEQVWSELKRATQKLNAGENDVHKVNKIINDALQSIDERKWSNYVAHAEKEETRFLRLENFIDAQVLPFIINIDEDESHSDGSCSDSE